MVFGRKKKVRGHGMYLLALLTQSPRSYEEIMNIMKRVPIQFGALSFLHDSNSDYGFMGKTKNAFNDLINKNLISKDETEHYHLTELGRPLGEMYAKRMGKIFNILSISTKPNISPGLSLLIHLFLGSIKIAGFFIIGSISLLGDGLDSLMDGISSIIVAVAMKMKREAVATLILLFLMLITGASILWQSINRLLNPIPLEEELTAILIAVISIILCSLLYFYQRYSGYRNRSLAILTQSEDSKNHVLNAFLVLIAIIAGIFEAYWMDGIVGCFIGFIILRGAYEIFMDLRATSQGEEVDFEKYKLGTHIRYEKVQDKQLESWILWKINNGVTDISELTQTLKEDFSPFTIQSITKNEFQIFDAKFGKDHLLNQVLQMRKAGLISQDSFQQFSLTEKGSKLLQEKIEWANTSETVRITHTIRNIFF